MNIFYNINNGKYDEDMEEFKKDFAVWLDLRPERVDRIFELAQKFSEGEGLKEVVLAGESITPMNEYV